jgi:type I restriction enzyme M protein
MAKEKKAPKKSGKEKAIEVSLWESANKLRGSVEPAEYKHVVLGLVFLKFASDKFAERRQQLIDEGKEKYLEMVPFYNEKNVFFLKKESRWEEIQENAKQGNLALIIDTALHTIEKDNKALKGALPDNYFSRLGLDPTKLAALADEISNIDTLKDKKQDIVGKVYQYFLKKFALAEGKGKGEFYTPESIVNLIAEMIEPYTGIIYDPACGSGGMFV